MKITKRRFLAGCLIAIGLVVPSSVMPVSALAVPAAPPLSQPVVDQTGTLSPGDVSAISSTINDSRSRKDYQMAVLMIPTLGTGEYIEHYALTVARQWGIGQDAKDNGVLLLVAKDDRKVRIEVGRGLEGDLTDAESNRIIRNVIAPEFRKGNYASGVSQAVTSIANQVEGKADPASQSSSSSSSSKFDWTWVFYLGFWILPWLASVLARSRSWWLGGVIGAGLGFGFAGLVGWAIPAMIAAGVLTLLGLLFDFIVSRNYRNTVSHGDAPSWWAGGTYWGDGGGFSGGSGGGFSGGDFGGGGSSGDW